MHGMTDAELIEQHREGSQEAFAELVRRHIDWVYSAAKRRVGDSHLAEDVTQAAFIALARKLPRLWAGSTLAPWLLTVVNLSSKAALRAQSTRRRHEIGAATMRSEIDPSGSVNWDDVTPHLDELVERLGRADRNVLMLRFYQQKSFAEVGAILGISEEAARKRTSRAVEQLRSMFTRRGVNASSMALGAVLLAEAAKPAPAALAATITSTATGVTITSSAMLAKGAIAIMAWTKIKFAAAVVLA
jgi:RNA polymerase sigma factor (sigma-70 family)